jgi:hypothetical protein
VRQRDREIGKVLRALGALIGDDVSCGEIGPMVTYAHAWTGRNRPEIFIGSIRVVYPRQPLLASSTASPTPPAPDIVSALKYLPRDPTRRSQARPPPPPTRPVTGYHRMACSVSRRRFLLQSGIGRRLKRRVDDTRGSAIGAGFGRGEGHQRAKSDVRGGEAGHPKGATGFRDCRAARGIERRGRGDSNFAQGYIRYLEAIWGEGVQESREGASSRGTRLV